MGIQQFYRWIHKTYPMIIEPTTLTSYQTICIDLNGIIHTSTQYVYRYGKYKHHPPFHLSPDEKYDILILTIRNTIYHYIHLFKPSHRIIFVMDGVSTKTKTITQRKRRFLNKYIHQFNINRISVGTRFVDKLTNSIYQIIIRLSKTLQVYFSDYRTPGESDYKIIQYIQSHIPINESVAIISNDSDYIILSLKLIHTRLDIVRYDAFQHYSSISIKRIKQKIIDTYTSIDDFILLVLLCFKNDYIHLTIPYSFSYVLNMYKQFHHPIIVHNNPSTLSFLSFLSFLYTGTTTSDLSGLVDTNPNINTKVYENYLKNIYWSFQYFSNIHICSWEWYNPLFSFPFTINDLILFLSQHLFYFETIEFTDSQPCSPFEQLIHILPPCDSILLPISLRIFINNNNIEQIPLYDKEYFKNIYTKIPLEDKIRNIRIYPLSIYNKKIFITK